MGYTLHPFGRQKLQKTLLNKAICDGVGVKSKSNFSLFRKFHSNIFAVLKYDVIAINL